MGFNPKRKQVFTFNNPSRLFHSNSSRALPPRTKPSISTSIPSKTPSKTPSKMTSLIAFYDGTGHDHRGRYLSDILKWDADKLESSHNYIQTLFPLPETSGVIHGAPIINRQVFDAFRSRAELRDQMRVAFKKILWFYGFELEVENGEVKIKKGGNYSLHSKNWDRRSNHNHLRITRIIRCLRVLGLEDEAQAFHSALEAAASYVGSTSRDFWQRAAEWPFNIRPDLELEEIDNIEDVGPKFLREYEAKKKAEEKKEDAEYEDWDGIKDDN